MKGALFVSKRYTKGVPFLAKMVYKSARGWTSGWSLPVEKIGKYPLYGAKNLLNDCRPLQTVWFKKKHINWVDFHFVNPGLIQFP